MTNVETWIEQLPEERQEPARQLINTVAEHLPKGFEQQVDSMVHFVVPLSRYPDGYHCTPGKPLPFISIDSTKKHIALHHMGMYGKPELGEWFSKAYKEQMKRKVNAGKSCIRFTKPKEIPYDLVAQLCQKMTVEDWISVYDKSIKR